MQGVSREREREREPGRGFVAFLLLLFENSREDALSFQDGFCVWCGKKRPPGKKKQALQEDVELALKIKAGGQLPGNVISLRDVSFARDSVLRLTAPRWEDLLFGF